MEVIRQLEISDLNSMINLRLEIQNYDLRYPGKDKTLIDEAELEKRSRKYLEESLNDNLYLFGLFINNELVSNTGFYLEKHFPTYTNPSGLIAYICNVYTKEEYRNKGYQKKVFNYTLKYAKDMGINKFQLSSLNEKAINMYKSFGFTKKNRVYQLEVEYDKRV